MRSKVMKKKEPKQNDDYNFNKKPEPEKLNEPRSPRFNDVNDNFKSNKHVVDSDKMSSSSNLKEAHDSGQGIVKNEEPKSQPKNKKKFGIF